MVMKSFQPYGLEKEYNYHLKHIFQDNAVLKNPKINAAMQQLK